MFPRWLTAGLAVLTLTACEGGGGPATPSAAPAAGSLAGVCPATVVVQTDWFPEAEYGAYFHMLGENPAFEVVMFFEGEAAKVATTPVTATGTVSETPTPAPTASATPEGASTSTDGTTTTTTTTTDGATK